MTEMSDAEIEAFRARQVEVLTKRKLVVPIGTMTGERKARYDRLLEQSMQPAVAKPAAKSKT